MSTLTRTRLILRDLTVGVAFFGVALSGSMPAGLVAFFAIAWGLALANRRVLSSHAPLGTWALVVAALAFFFAGFQGVFDWIVAATAFATLVLIHRLHSTPQPSVDRQLQALSMLTLAGGAALTGDWLYGLVLALFMVLATLSVGLHTLEEFSFPATLSLKFPIRQLIISTIFTIVGAVVFFLAVPRLSWNMVPPRSSPGLGPATPGIAERIKLSRGGGNKTNFRTVARIKLSPDPQVEKLDAYFIAQTFSLFSGTDWSGTVQGQLPSHLVSLGPESQDTVRQHIEILPAYGSTTLFALETPVSFSQAVGRESPSANSLKLVHFPEEQVQVRDAVSTFHYRASSQKSLEYKPQPGGPQDADYLQLPENLNPQISELAESILNGETDPLRAAERLKAYLQSEHQYSLDETEVVDDPLSAFLFQTKRGHCEHFASALTILLRTQGFAARVASGFFGGHRVADAYVLRAGDAHAWTQVWVPEKGFITVDATPEAHRSGQPSVFLEVLAQALEWVESAWRQRVLDYSLEDQVTWVRAKTLSADKPGSLIARGRSWMKPFLGALFFLIFGIGAYRFWRLRDKTTQRRSTALMNQLETVLQNMGIPMEVNECPERRAYRLEDLSPSLGAAYRKPLRLYLESRFGKRQLTRREISLALTEFKRAAKLAHSRLRVNAA